MDKKERGNFKDVSLRIADFQPGRRVRRLRVLGQIGQFFQVDGFGLKSHFDLSAGDRQDFDIFSVQIRPANAARINASKTLPTRSCNVKTPEENPGHEGENDEKVGENIETEIFQFPCFLADGAIFKQHPEQWSDGDVVTTLQAGDILGTHRRTDQIDGEIDRQHAGHKDEGKNAFLLDRKVQLVLVQADKQQKAQVGNDDPYRQLGIQPSQFSNVRGEIETLVRP